MIKVKVLNSNAIMPTRANPTDAGLDLYANNRCKINVLERSLVTTGIAIEIPSGYVARIAPRSGLAFKYGVDVLAGVIDSSYRGEIKIILINHGDDNFYVEPGDKIAQLLIQPVELWNPVEVDKLTETSRGANGFGSTGI